MTSTNRALVFALTHLGSIAGDKTGDYLVQRDCDATTKQQRTPEGRRALAIHAATYAATQHLTKAAVYRVTGVRVPVLAQLAGTVTEGVIHAIVDDGRLLRRFADAVGKRRFHDLADGGVNGRMLLDRATHEGLQIPIGAAVTTLVTAWLHRRTARPTPSA